MFGKVKQILSFIRHPPCYYYILKMKIIGSMMEMLVQNVGSSSGSSVVTHFKCRNCYWYIFIDKRIKLVSFIIAHLHITFDVSFHIVKMFFELHLTFIADSLKNESYSPICFYMLARQTSFKFFSRIKTEKLAHTFNSSFRYIDHVLSLSNSRFGDYLYWSIQMSLNLIILKSLLLTLTLTLKSTTEDD